MNKSTSDQQNNFDKLITEFRAIAKEPYINSLIIFDKLKEAEAFHSFNNNPEFSFNNFCKKVFKE